MLPEGQRSCCISELQHLEDGARFHHIDCHAPLAQALQSLGTMLQGLGPLQQGLTALRIVSNGCSKRLQPALLGISLSMRPVIEHGKEEAAMRIVSHIYFVMSRLLLPPL